MYSEYPPSCYVGGRGTPSAPRGQGVAAASTGRMCRIGPTVTSQSEHDELTALLAGALELELDTASRLLVAAGWNWERMKDSLSKEQRQRLFNQEQALRDFEEKRSSERDSRPAPAGMVRPPTNRAPGQQA